MKEVKLTPKQEKFCHLYIETGNASEAYTRSYDCSRMKDEVINVKSLELLNNGKITVRVKELQEEIKVNSDVKKENLLRELSNIAFSSIAQFYIDWTQLVDFDQLTDRQKSCIKSITTKVVKRNIGTKEKPDIVDVEYTKIEMHDKSKAIERICKMLNYDSPSKFEIEAEIQHKPLTKEQAKRIIDELG